MKRYLIGLLLMMLLVGSQAWADTVVYGEGRRFHLSKTITVPTTSDDYAIGYVPWALTVQGFHGTCVTATSLSFTLQYCDADGVSNCSGISNEMTVTSGTSATGTIASPSVAAGKMLRVNAGTKVGSPSYCTYTVWGVW